MATIKTRTTEVKDILYKNYTAYGEYQKIEAVIPEGYEWTGEFRYVKPDEKFLGTNNQLYTASDQKDDCMFTAYPRFILREIHKISEPVKKSFLFRFIRRGVPKINEWYDNGIDIFYLSNGKATGYYDIYERIVL